MLRVCVRAIGFVRRRKKTFALRGVFFSRAVGAALRENNGKKMFPFEFFSPGGCGVARKMLWEILVPFSAGQVRVNVFFFFSK